MNREEAPAGRITAERKRSPEACGDKRLHGDVGGEERGVVG